VGEVAYLLFEDRFGFISSKVFSLFKPKPIVKNTAAEWETFLKECENPLALPLPPSEAEVSPPEGYELSVFFRLAYPFGIDRKRRYRIKELKLSRSEAIFFEMRFLAGGVPFADLSVARLYVLEEL